MKYEENLPNFEKLGLNQDLLKVLAGKGFVDPTEIQEKAIPLALAGKDIVAGSATGSGKTLVFASVLVEKLKANKTPQALILAPTRELVEQIADAIEEFSYKKNFNILKIYGGVDMDAQVRKVRTADIIVATPGRLLDHLRRKTLNLNNIKFLILDEVDRMFDMGFYKDVESIMRQCSKTRQTMFFSATITSNIDYFSKKYTTNPAEVSAVSYVDPSKLTQVFYDVPARMKFSLLVHLLKKEGSDLVMVFCGTRVHVDFVANNLKEQGIDAKPIHGGLSQNKRTNVLKLFHGKGVAVLVCTDVAARGLDIKGVSHVYNYDIPPTSEDYIHRIGRTARAGKEGRAINLLSDRDYNNFNNVLKNDSLNITSEELPIIEELKTVRPVRESRGRFKGSGHDRPQVGRFNSSNRDRPRRDSRHSGSSGYFRDGRSRSTGRFSSGPSKFGRSSSGFSRGSSKPVSHLAIPGGVSSRPFRSRDSSSRNPSGYRNSNRPNRSSDKPSRDRPSRPGQRRDSRSQPRRSSARPHRRG